jgi:hypothetical protein
MDSQHDPANGADGHCDDDEAGGILVEMKENTNPINIVRSPTVVAVIYSSNPDIK